VATVSMSEGARLCGRSKGTLSKALTSGRMSYVEKTDAGYLIDTSELFRVFPPKPLHLVPDARSETLSEPGEKAAFTEGLRVEIQLLREQLADTRVDRDAWREQAQRLLLEAPAVVVPPAPVEPQPRRWWRFGRD
jgi:hypothetical protein